MSGWRVYSMESEMAQGFEVFPGRRVVWNIYRGHLCDEHAATELLDVIRRSRIIAQ